MSGKAERGSPGFGLAKKKTCLNGAELFWEESGGQLSLLLLCWVRGCCFSCAMRAWTCVHLCPVMGQIPPQTGSLGLVNAVFVFLCGCPHSAPAQQCHPPGGGRWARGCSDFGGMLLVCREGEEVAGAQSLITYARSSWQRLKGFLISSQRQIRIQQQGS